MRIDEILSKKRTLSFEVFPPKKDAEERGKIFSVIDALKEVSPDFISVTYGAGGSNSKNTVEIADYIQNNAKLNALAHITGGPSSPADVDEVASALQKRGIENFPMRPILPSILRPIILLWARHAIPRGIQSANRSTPILST